MNRFSDISDVNRYLDRLPSFQVHGAVAARLGLGPMRDFFSRTGRPERSVPAIHVAGTNGKGSVSAILAKVYQEAGFTCGLFTSPHLMDLRERFRINGIMIEEEELIRFFQLHAGLLEELKPSYFEISVAIAFWWFRERNVDLAVIETGLGGRLDATNIIVPMISVITSVGYDHMNFLGSTIRAIATEKAGIIKEGRPVVIGSMPATARDVITRIAEKHGSELLDARSMRPRFTAENHTKGIRSRIRFNENGRRIEVNTDLAAPVQRWNVAMARLVTILLNPDYPVSLPLFQRAIRDVHGRGWLPGRFERLHPRLPWYFDGAHNTEAVGSLIDTIQRHEWGTEPVMVLSLMKDKAEKKILTPFSVFKKNYYYTLHMERAADITQITPYLPDIKPLPPQEEEIIDFLAGLEEQVVIFTGSFYFYSRVKRWISRIIRTL
ncbi:Mur ligase family protein [Balneolales bacterium ANBcel1]|nr:Mur ligase family protein [Balneolales bacterium ANBcel1]